MNTTEKIIVGGFTALILGLVVLCAAMTYEDMSELTPYSYTGVVVDKWHENRCSPIFDGDGNYYGEDCSDVYTIITDLQDYGRLEKRLSFPEFSHLPVGAPVIYSYDTGKLGWKHNESLELGEG